MVYTILIRIRGKHYMDIGKRIKDLRIKSGFSQNALADFAGVSQTHLRRIELGQADVTVGHLQLICDALEISLKDFFSIDENKEEFSLAIAKLSPRQKQLLLEFLNSL